MLETHQLQTFMYRTEEDQARAVQFTGTLKQAECIHAFYNGTEYEYDHNPADNNTVEVTIHHANGAMLLKPGDWFVELEPGAFTILTDQQFAAEFNYSPESSAPTSHQA